MLSRLHSPCTQQHSEICGGPGWKKGISKNKHNRHIRAENGNMTTNRKNGPHSVAVAEVSVITFYLNMRLVQFSGEIATSSRDLVTLNHWLQIRQTPEILCAV